MFTLRTVQEKAVEWGVTPRHVQYLCREGKVEGAIKRAGAWFIPEEAPSPIKNTKADDKSFKFVGTKKRIFDNAIDLFMQRGYENVSMWDIADSVGIRQSAVYNHFKSKHEILDTLYGFYRHNNISNRPTLDDIESLLQTGNLIDVIAQGFVYVFGEDTLNQMLGISKIITQRITTDEKASELFQELLLREGIAFVEDGLNKAVEVGRLKPFDTHTVAVLINCIRLYTLLWWLASPPPEAYISVTKDEQAMYEFIARALADHLNGPMPSTEQ